MAAVYIREQGALVQKSGERMVVTKNGKTLFEIPVLQTENLSLMGNVQVTAQALHMLMEHGVDISHFSYGGRYIGHTAAEASKNIFLRFAQYQYYLNETERLKMARNIVDNKIKNQIFLIKSHRWTEIDYDWHADVLQMEKHRMSLETRETPTEILGTEGICSNIYFGAFGKMLKGDVLFSGRNRRPPKDPANALISLTYAFLTREICTALDGESFETYLGFLHGIRYGRKSLALDIVEEFRQPAADRFVLQMFNKRMISIYDFEFSDHGGVYLTEDGFRKFCTEYEKWISGKNSVSGKKSFRGCIRRQVSMLKKAICENGTYQPYSWDGACHSADTDETAGD